MKFKLKNSIQENQPKAIGYCSAFGLENHTDVIEYELKQENNTVTVILPNNKTVTFDIIQRYNSEFFNAIKIDYDNEDIVIKKSSSISMKYIVDWYIIPRIIAEHTPHVSRVGTPKVKKAITPEDKERKAYESKIVDLIMEGYDADEAKKLVDESL